MIVRPATAADVPAIASVFEASGDDVTWPGMPGWPYVEHLVARARVAVTDVDGLVVGFGGAIDVGRPDVRFLTDLFVRPDRQDQGAGRALLATLFDGTTERLTFSSSDPRALGTYIRAGMRPWWPVLYLDVPAPALSAIDPADRSIVVDAADVATTATWSARWTGMDRAPDFAYYERLPAGTGHLLRDDGVVAGVAWSNLSRSGRSRVLDHVSIAPDADPFRITLAIARAALGGSASLSLTIPGPHPAVAWLLERGARIVDRDQYCATDAGLLDPERILPSPGFL